METIKKHKVRLVARGDLQDPSTYGDTYAGAAKASGDADAKLGKYYNGT